MELVRSFPKRDVPTATHDHVWHSTRNQDASVYTKQQPNKETSSSPEHGGNPDLAYPPPSSPHFRSNMQSPGPPYQGTMGSGMNYSERPYENQMGSHCQSNSYPSYQPPSPYRPHPVSPPAHAHQYSSHGTPQMHSALPYSSGHQLGPYGSSQSHYGSINQEMYGSRPSVYSSGGRSMQQLKPAWGDNNNSSTDIMQYNQPLPRPPMMPPPPMHSPPHASMSATPGPPPPPPHYRQMPIVSSSSHSPHSWSQSQIPSPSVLHSPRTTPSPLPNPTRSPGHGQPFSPPPAAPSPHHPPPAMTPHPQPQKPVPSPPTTVSSGSSQQPLCSSPSSQVGNTDPLQSLQKMVMLDSETVESPITRASYEMAASQGNPPVTSRPSSYFSVEQLAGSDPGSPYPTYYNLDQNRLCTPPRTCMSTPTSSTFSSAPDSTSSNSPRSDSRTTTASADSSTVGHVNGELPQSDNQGRRQDFDSFGVTDVRITNGNHPGDISTRDEFGPVSSDSENKDSQDFIHHLSNNSDIPEGDGRVDLRTAIRKSPKSPRGRRRPTGQELHSDPLLMENPMDKLPRNKTILMTAGRRNSTLQEFEITNGQPEVTTEENYQNDGFTSRPVRYFSPAGRWNRIPNIGDNFTNTQEKNCFAEDCIGMTVATPTKRGRRRKNFASHEGMPPDWDLTYNSDMGIQRPPRAMRNPSRGRRGGRRRGAGVFPVGSGYGETHLDMYHNENHHLSARSHPANGLSEVSNVNPSEKSMTWQSHALHIGPSQSIGTEYNLKDDVSLGAKPPIIEPLPISNSSVNSALPNAQQSVAYNSDIPPEDRARGPLIFTVTKDGNTVKLQEGPLSNAASTQQQFYDSSLGQVPSQPPKKKRGRPFGSKNKPKPPGEVRQPRRRRRKGEIALEIDQMQVVKKPILGPYIHIVGTREKPITVMVVNVQIKEEEKDVKLLKQKRQLQLGNAIRQKLGLGPCSTLSPLYDAVSKDKSWLCALCCKGNHYQGQGDLFGPYYLNGDQKPSTASNPSSPAPPTVSGTSDAAEGEGEDEHQDAVDIMSNGPLRRVRAKRRSELVEQFFKTALYKKSKQLKEQSLKRSESDDEVETAVDEVASPIPKDEQLKVVLKDEKTSRENELQKLPPSYTPEVKLTLMTPSILMTGRDTSLPDVIHNVRDFKIKPQNGAQSCINSTTPEEESISEIQSQKSTDIQESTPNADVPPSSPSQFQVDTPTDNKEFWVHEDCALWSHGVYLIGDKMYGLEDAVLEAAEMVCSKCKFSGASLGCLNKGCTEQYHYLCARDKGCEMDEDTFSILCPKHKKKPRTEKQSAEG